MVYAMIQKAVLVLPHKFIFQKIDRFFARKNLPLIKQEFRFLAPTVKFLIQTLLFVMNW